MDKKLISVVVPVYNGETTLKRCIASIENQTYENIEIIIVDDGSCDNSLTVACGLAQRYANIRVEKIAHGGVSAARNAGIEHACGEYISFIDCDDTVHKDMLSVMAHELEENGVQLAVVGIERIEESMRIFEPYDEREIVYIDNAARLQLKPMYFNSCSNKLYIASVIKENNIRFVDGVRIGEDFLFNAEYIKFAEKTAVVSKAMYTYDMSGSTLRPSADVSRFDVIARMYSAIMPFAENDPELEACIKRKICDEYIFGFRVYCMSDEPFWFKLRAIRKVMKSEQYRAVKNRNSHIEGVYGRVIRSGSAAAVCAYFEVSRRRHKIK